MVRRINMKLSTTITTLLLLITVSGSAFSALNVGKAVDFCPSDKDSKRVIAMYKELPGAPMPILARRLHLPEVQVTTSIPAANRISAKVTPDQIKDIWTTIDAWGEKTQVRLIYTLGGNHVYNFPSYIPMRQEDLDDGWLDIYADNGKGVHGHLWLDPIHSVHAVDIEDSDGEHTRSISFYTEDGNLAIGVYSSVAGKDFDQAAVDGFISTRKFLSELPKICH